MNDKPKSPKFDWFQLIESVTFPIFVALQIAALIVTLFALFGCLAKCQPQVKLKSGTTQHPVSMIDNGSIQCETRF